MKERSERSSPVAVIEKYDHSSSVRSSLRRWVCLSYIVYWEEKLHGNIR